jgi:ABC-type branched-subunit amino acid transport system substrate-binding protein
MRISSKIGILVLAVLLIMLPLLTACSDDEQEIPTLSTELTMEPMEDVKITIGVISDKTGPAANAYIDIDMALADVVEYYNKENLIPGVKLEVITYDGQFDPSRDIPGYKWLKERGADLIFSSIESTPIVLKPFVDKDKIVMFTGSALKEAQPGARPGLA